MSGGTQVTTTTTQPWEAQEPYLIEGMKKAAGLYEGGEFAPEFYGAPGTQAPGAAAIGQVAPGVAAFDPQQQQAMQRAYGYAMGPVPEAYSASAAGGMFGPAGILPYAQSAMGHGYTMGQPQTQAGYAGMTPFSEDQYGGLLAGDVDTTQFGDVADVYRREAMGQLEEEMLPGIRSKMVGFQPGGGTRGDLLQSKALSSASQRVSDNIAKAMFGAQQQAEAMRLPAAQMGLGAQQFGMGYGLQGMEGARGALGMYPSLMSAPMGMYGAAQGIGAQQQALDQAALDYDVGRYDYQAQMPQQALGQYLAGVSGDYGGMASSTGPGGAGGAEAMIAALAAKAIGL
jgi:hypothetical protein